MSDCPREASEPVVEAEDGRSGRRPLQVGLRTLFLLLAAVAVWLAFFTNRREIGRLEARIRALTPMAHELVVDDPRKVAVVKREESWYDENRWDVYLPPGRTYRLCVATRDIKVEEDSLAPAKKSTALNSGRHVLSLDVRKVEASWNVVVACDGSDVLTVEEPGAWDEGSGSTGGGRYPTCEQLAPDKPVILFRRRFMKRQKKGSSTTPAGPTEGVLLWIEPATGTREDAASNRR